MSERYRKHRTKKPSSIINKYFTKIVYPKYKFSPETYFISLINSVLTNRTHQNIQFKEMVINENTEEAAKITCEFNGNSIEEELEYLRKGNYSTETSGLFELSQFMYENGFVEKAAENYYDLAFENVKGN